MLLVEHIKKEWGGNQYAFARHVKKGPKQVQRWIAQGCEWENGRVQLLVTKWEDKNVLDKRNKEKVFK